MICSRCQHQNRPGAKFCEECATPLLRQCAQCGGQLSASAKFCPECAHPASGDAVPAWAPKIDPPRHLANRILSSRAALEGERKQVTILFADLKGSMELLAERDPEDAHRILEAVVEKMVAAVHRFDGTVNQVMGDGIMALFGAPLALEDHAVRACYAALAMQTSLREHAEALRRDEGVIVQVRVGINSGEVVVGAIGSDLRMEYTAVGQSTHLAARMEQLAAPGTILLSSATVALVEGFVQVKSLGPVPVKGMPQPVEVFEVLGTGLARTRLQAAALRGLSKFIGRSTEMTQMFAALERAGAGCGEVVALVGEPGVGKSRLVWEFTHSHRTQSWYVLESSSVSYGRASAYRPVIDLLHAYFQLESQDNAQRIRERVIGKILALDRALEAALTPLLALLDVPVDDANWARLDPQLKRRRMLDACRGLLLRESQRQPLIVIFEDLHWIDTESQALLDALVENLPSARLMLLVNYRPEYQNRWTRKTYYTQLRIDPLGNDSAGDFLDALLGGDPSLAALRKALLERTACNPLFMEESVRGLLEAGDLVGERGAYRATTTSRNIEVPKSVQAVLAARIDRLSPDDKHLLQIASVIAKDVPYQILHAVAGLTEAVLQERLAALQAAEFIYEVSLYPDREYTFKHALTHEVTYGGILQDRRRELHGRIVVAMEDLLKDRLQESLDLIGHQAFQAEMWERAFTYLYEAGKKAYLRSAARSAIASYDRALVAFDRLKEDGRYSKQAIGAHIDLSQAWIHLGDFEKDLFHCRKAESLAERIDDDGQLAWAIGGVSIALFSVGDNDGALTEAMRAEHVFGRSSDASLRGMKGFYPALVHSFTGRYREGASEVSGAVRTLIDLADSPETRLPRSQVLKVAGLGYAFLGWCQAELGLFDEAEAATRQSLELLTEFGLEYRRMYALHRMGFVHVLRGEAQRALTHLETCDAIARDIDNPTIHVQLGSCLGDAFLLVGRIDDAVFVQERAHRIATQTNNMAWLPLVCAQTAHAYAHAGRVDEAINLAQRGLDLARKHKARGHEAWALHALTRAYLAAGDYANADAQGTAAIALTHELGMRPLQARCHLALGEVCLRTSERSGADRHLDTATEMFRAMGISHWPHEVSKLRSRTESRGTEWQNPHQGKDS